ncbi:uncharacterized protein LOC132703216 [Cylas formicarius]|uniref:uncharacterized protein LOC132703216 n=1 Tax=Cylas formicarius TaxID=197179 RepID=UPI002958887A|nr:uncharacterized protein LOC132703216 [Cylas formicarius]
MFLGKKLCFFFSVTCFLALAESEEVLCSVNGVRVLNKVSDKFLSVSIDPAILFNGLNLSEASLLAKYLSPAYVRLAGPSTRLVRYQDQSFYSDTEQVKNGVITPSIWLGVNQWFDSTDLTPVFGISDVDVKSDGSWDPTPTLPLFDVTNELGFDCHWQLGYGEPAAAR